MISIVVTAATVADQEFGSSLRIMGCVEAPEVIDGQHAGIASLSYRFPNTDNHPSLLSQSACHQAVTILISTELGCPPLCASLWRRRVLWFRAAVPKAAIHKHRHLFAAKDEIRPPEQPYPTPPSRDPVHPHQRHHPKFRIPVPTPANRRHHRAAFSLGEDVRHLHRAAF